VIITKVSSFHVQLCYSDGEVKTVIVAIDSAIFFFLAGAVDVVYVPRVTQWFISVLGWHKIHIPKCEK
jgi:hypothetical protein